ncbi:ATP-binding protein [Geodermatophilus sp. SYSU D01176]
MDGAADPAAAPASSQDPGTGGLRVRLFGSLDLRLGETPMPALGSNRAESLLAYLVLHREHPQSREHLAFLLWPDSTRSQARTNLRHVLHRLSHTLPELERFLDIGPRTLRWRREAPWWSDVAEFERSLAEGRLREAVELYSGDLLEASDDDWLGAERERLAQLHRDAVDRLARTLGAERRWAEALRYAERLVRLDPLREESYGLLIRLCDAAGERTRGLRAYHACEATLQQELGIAPSAATRRAYETLLLAGAQPATPGGRPASPTRPPLVGRATERARLTTVWRSACSGRAQLALVTGEPGVGKTRLVEELSAWCARTGAVTAEARAYPAEGTLAYGPVAAWLRAEGIAAGLPGLDRTDLTELARLLPELLAEIPGLPAPGPLPEGEQRARLFRALTRAVLPPGTPVLLVADDLQWYDQETLQFLHYLLRTQPDGRLLVAATVRHEDVDPGDPVRRLLVAVQALGRSVEIPLVRLGPEETATLGERVAGRPMAAAEAERLYAVSEGNPLFVVEALRADPTGRHPPPPGSRAHAVIATRLAQLSEPAAALVGVAATIGREFTAPLLARAGGMEEAQFVRGLDELWRRGLVRAFGPNAYDFSHGQIRAAAYRALSPAQLRGHHLRVARALQHTAGDGDVPSGRIAVHLDRAGAAAEAVAAYERAAADARRLHANAEAVRLLERALELATDLPARPSTDALRLRLLAALPPPLIATEGYLSPRVTDVHARALPLARTLGAEPMAPLVWSLAMATLTRCDFAGARPLGEELRRRAERDGDDVLWVQSAYLLGVAAFWQGRLETARAEFEAAVDRYRADQRATHVQRYGQDPDVFCRMRLAYTLWLLGHPTGAERARETALAMAERTEHPYTRWVAHIWSGLLALDQRDTLRLRHHLHALQPDGSVEQPGQVLLPAAAFAGLLAVLDGRPEAGLDRLRRTLAEARGGPPTAPGVNGILGLVLVQALDAAGEPRAGLAAADEALALGEGAQLWEPELRRLRARFHRALGAERRAVEELEQALAVARRQGARTVETRIEAALAGLRTAGTR